MALQASIKVVVLASWAFTNLNGKKGTRCRVRKIILWRCIVSHSQHWDRVVLDSCIFRGCVWISQIGHISSCRLWCIVCSRNQNIGCFAVKITSHTFCVFLLSYHFCLRQSSWHLVCGYCFVFFAIWNMSWKFALQVHVRVDVRRPNGSPWSISRAFSLVLLNHNKVKTFRNGWQQVEKEKKTQDILHLSLPTTV